MGRFPGAGAVGFGFPPEGWIGLVGLVAVFLLCRSILVRTLRSKANLFYPVFIACCGGSIALVEAEVIRGFWIDSTAGLFIAVLIVAEVVLYNDE